MIKGVSLNVSSALALVALTGAVHASGFNLLEQNASGIGNAYAGSAAVAENASTIYYNPAGMTELPGVSLSAGVAGINPSYRFTNGSSTASGSNGGDAGGWAAVPNGYAAWALTKDLYVGLGISSPFGLKTEYASDWVGRSQSIKFEIKTVNVNPSVAYRVNDKVSVGFGLNWQRIEAEYVRAAGAGQVRLNVDDSAWGWNAGALFTVSPTTKVGLSYRSAIQYHTSGTFNGVLNANASANLKVPDTFIMSVTQKLNDKWEMLGDISRTGWSSIPKVDIMNTSTGAATPAQTLNTDFRNTWRVSLGANYHYSDTIKLKFGLAYDQSPVKSPSTRLASLPDNNRVWISAGGQYRINKLSAVDLGVAYIYLRDPAIDNTSNLTTVNGTYAGSVWVVGGQYSHAF